MQGRGTCRRAAGEDPQHYQGSLATILIVGKDGDNGNEGEQGCPENSGHQRQDKKNRHGSSSEDTCRVPTGPTAAGGPASGGQVVLEAYHCVLGGGLRVAGWRTFRPRSR